MGSRPITQEAKTLAKRGEPMSVPQALRQRGASLLVESPDVDEGKQTMLESVCNIQRLAILDVDPRIIFDSVLSEFLKLTGSEYGFIGEVLYSKEREQEYLKTHAITNIAWDEETMLLFKKNARDGMEFFNLNSLFGAVIRTCKAVLSNAPQEDTRSCGLPAGHPPMHSFLGLPLVDGGELIGMIGIANCPEGYDESFEPFLDPLITASTQLVRAYQVRRERKSAEAELRRSEERRHQLELAHIARVASAGELAASLAHELNQPLCAIVNNARAAQRQHRNGAPKEIVSDTLSDIVSDAKRAGAIITRLRDFLRKGQVRREAFDINQAVTAFVAMLKDIDPIRSACIATELEPGLPLMVGDKVQIEQVILNLIRNAMEAMEDVPEPEREITISTGRSSPHTIAVTVADKGKGITFDEVDQMFDPFYTDKEDGMGMGLPISRTIVEAHGGSLTVTNPGHAGARIQFTLMPEGLGSDEQ
jgi:signal transduction histidine kinase